MTSGGTSTGFGGGVDSGQAACLSISRHSVQMQGDAMPQEDSRAARKVAKVMHEFKAGELVSSSGQKVKSRKQAIAIGLSEARAIGAKAPPPPRQRTSKGAKAAR
jgi:hypothetical protein